MSAADGRGRQTLLLERILHAWQLPHPAALIEHVHATTDKAVIANLAPLVCTAARAGDATARRILQRAASELAQSALTVAGQLDLPTCLPLALGGSLLTRAADLRELLLAHLRRRGADVTSITVSDPAGIAARALPHVQGKGTHDD
jgi:N-acetylglucosamine kinase-like BadF-type ATPase